MPSGPIFCFLSAFVKFPLNFSDLLFFIERLFILTVFESVSFRAEGKDVHSIIADPLFVNPTANDFKFVIVLGFQAVVVEVVLVLVAAILLVLSHFLIVTWMPTRLL